ERDRAEGALHDLRNQLAHVTRVATAGESSAAIAHEIRQPLASILSNAEAAGHLLASSEPKIDEVREILSDIAKEDMRAADILTRVRSFLKKGESQFQTIELETVVRDALALGRGAIAAAGVDVQTQIAAGLPRMKGDPVQLLQVVLNLIVNACDSMNSNSNSDLRLQVQVLQTTEGDLEVMIADHGVGLPAGAEDRVFEP